MSVWTNDEHDADQFVKVLRMRRSRRHRRHRMDNDRVLSAGIR